MRACATDRDDSCQFDSELAINIPHRGTFSATSTDAFADLEATFHAQRLFGVRAITALAAHADVDVDTIMIMNHYSYTCTPSDAGAGEKNSYGGASAPAITSSHQQSRRAPVACATASHASGHVHASDNAVVGDHDSTSIANTGPSTTSSTYGPMRNDVLQRRIDKRARKRKRRLASRKRKHDQDMLELSIQLANKLTLPKIEA